jgi:hypothetical protein
LCAEGGRLHGRYERQVIRLVGQFLAREAPVAVVDVAASGRDPVDFRRGADELAATVRTIVRQDPFCRMIFVFPRSGRTG